MSAKSAKILLFPIQERLGGKPAKEVRIISSQYDPKTKRFVPKVIIKKEGGCPLPRKDPLKVKTDARGRFIIEPGQIWQMKVRPADVVVPVNVVVKGFLYDEEKLVFHHFDYPDALEEKMLESTFRVLFIPYDLSPA